MGIENPLPITFVEKTIDRGLAALPYLLAGVMIAGFTEMALGSPMNVQKPILLSQHSIASPLTK